VYRYLKQKGTPGYALRGYAAWVQSESTLVKPAVVVQAPPPAPSTAPTPAPAPASDPVVSSTSTVAFIGPAQVATLPRVQVDATYPAVRTQTRIAAGADLQAALRACTGELLLPPGATWIGNFMLPLRPTSDVCVIRTDLTDAQLGAPGTRMTPSRAGTVRLTRILTPNGQPVLDTELGAHHYRLTGVELGATSAAADVNALVRFGSSSRRRPMRTGDEADPRRRATSTCSPR
jgi:hypothetical protein